MSTIKTETKQLLTYTNALQITDIDSNKNYNSLQIRNMINTINKDTSLTVVISKFLSVVKKAKRSQMIKMITLINTIIKTYSIQTNKLCHSGIKVTTMRQDILKFVEDFQQSINIHEWSKLLYID